MLQYFLSIATWFMFFIAVEHLGQRELAVANIVRSIYVVMLIPVNSLATTTNTFVSNSIGAGAINQVIPTIWKICKLSLGIMVVFAAIVSLMPGWVVSVYTNDASLVAASVPSVYVIVGSLLIGSVANVAFNGVSGTGNTRSALLAELVTAVAYTLAIYFLIFRLRPNIASCWIVEYVYWGVLLLFSFIYLKKADWWNKKI